MTLRDDVARLDDALRATATPLVNLVAPVFERLVGQVAMTLDAGPMCSVCLRRGEHAPLCPLHPGTAPKEKR